MDAQVNDDTELVRRMLRGEEAAFNDFFEANFARLYRFALPRLNGDADATEEVVQLTLTRAMQRLSTFRGEAALFTWICQICRRQVADYVRAQHRRTDRVVLIDDSPGVRAALDSIAVPEAEGPAGQYGQGEVKRLVQVVLDRLPASYGDALEWKYVEGLSVTEIGQRLGVTRTAAQSLLARARDAFRESLDGVFSAEELAILVGPQRSDCGG
jgi:RNA polymerase sigma-70 factor (ECF subfamily)